MTTVNDLLKAKPQPAQLWSVAPDDTVYTALELLAAKDVGALLVLDGERLVGIFSERDYARRGVLLGRVARQARVRELMTTSLYHVTPEHSLERCMLLMANKHVRHLPVLSAAGGLVGIVAVGDVLRGIIAEQRGNIVRLNLYETPEVEGQSPSCCAGDKL
jgi:CBS domain-containing protein